MGNSGGLCEGGGTQDESERVRNRLGDEEMVASQEKAQAGKQHTSGRLAWIPASSLPLSRV